MTGTRRPTTPEQQVVALGRLIEDQTRTIEALKAEIERRFNAQAGDVAAVKRDAVQATRAAGRALDLITDLAERLGDDQGDDREKTLPVCLLTPKDGEETLQALQELRDWLRAVYVRYEGGDDVPAPEVSDCWPWHTGAVTELWVLYRMWWAAYHGPKASDQMVADWHDRYRLGAVRRVNAALRNCRPEKHTDRMAYRPAGVHGDEMLDELAEWMVTSDYGRSSPPAPTAAMVKESQARRSH